MQHHVQTAHIFHNNLSVCLGNGHSIAKQITAAVRATADTRVKRALSRTLLHTRSEAWPRHTLSEPQRQEEESQLERIGYCVRVFVCAAALPVSWTSARLLEQHTCVPTAEKNIDLPISVQNCHCTKL
ncbi:hypothetical protein QQF64_022021 [Cirrhinus molitorella]|uniref:Uncharacterized protein n=1 Tax=Cirrhinus molitorella TaxID=172907 RepID=A0ABR3LAY8_9TELE